MKVKIIKEPNGAYTISIEERVYTLKIKLTPKGVEFFIQERDLNQILLESYRETFSLRDFVRINKIFSFFKNGEEALNGIKAQLDLELFDLKKEGKEVIILFYIFGQTIELKILNELEKKEITEEEEKKIILDDYKERIKELESDLLKTKFLGREIIKEALMTQKEKDVIIESFKEVLKECVKDIKNEENKIKIEISKVESFQILAQETHHRHGDNLQFDLSKTYIIKTIQENSGYVHSLCILKDGRLASCSSDETIKIYDQEFYQSELIIVGHKNQVRYITTLNNGHLLSSSSDKTMKIWEISKDKYNLVSTLEGHEGTVLKAIELSNDRIGSCSTDKTIKIWKFSDGQYKCIKTITEYTTPVYSLIELNKKNLIVSGSEGGSLRFWNTSTYELKKMLHNVACHANNGLIKTANEEKIIVSSDAIYIINLEKLEIEKQLSFQGLCYVYSLLQTGPETVLCGGLLGDAYSLINVDIKFSQFSYVKKGVHSTFITGLIKIDESTIASCSVDKTIKIWRSWA